jgi:hypothetical protein
VSNPLSPQSGERDGVKGMLKKIPEILLIIFLKI